MKLYCGKKVSKKDKTSLVDLFILTFTTIPVQLPSFIRWPLSRIAQKHHLTKAAKIHFITLNSLDAVINYFIACSESFPVSNPFPLTVNSISPGCFVA